MFAQRVLTGTAVIALVVALSACAAEEVPAAEPETPEPTPTVVETEEPEAPELSFVMPADCTTILPQERLDSFAEQGLELLGGPGSVYGDDYFFDPTPEQLVGGISCVYAEDGTDLSSLLVSVAPVSAATRAQIINVLAAQGLNEGTTDDRAVTYSQFGDESAAPAIYNVITNESWVSVISAFGGQLFYEEAVSIADDVTGEVYQ